MATFKRAQRVADRILEEVADILHKEVGDPRLAMVTLTGAKVSDDLRNARIYFVEMGQETCRAETKAALLKASGFLRREWGRRLQLRYVPEIIFMVDESFAYGDRIDRLINEIHSSEETDGSTDNRKD
ncbi:MAG: 30S ribosome-binding factor RbfA [Syntrophales bacterium]|nr:30S ribosome-binding factor RbfA [Syntrophales bacterium]